VTAVTFPAVGEVDDRVATYSWCAAWRPIASPYWFGANPKGATMLEAIARLAITRPRRILAAAVLFMIAAAVVGIPVSRSLSTGGFQDPTSESSSASQVLTDKFAAGDMRLILAVHADGGVDSPAARTAGGRLTAMLEHSPYVTTVTSAWTVPAAAMTALISKDGNTGLVIAGIGGGETSAQEHARQVVAALPQVEGVTVKAGGEAMANVQMVEQSRKDMVVLEMIAIPVSLIILLWVFGGVVAAVLPVAVGLFAILGSMAVLRLVTMATEVSVFALNLVSALGLALAIDYTLLIVSRFRDEVSAGALPRDALTRTMTTAGRTVLFSATTVALSMVAMVMFPMPFLKSLAYAGIAVVVFAAAAALLLTPALIVVTGERLNSYDLRKFVRRAVGRSEPAARPVEQTFWYRWAKGAMRHAIPVSIGIVAVLLLLGTPFLGVKWGHPDDRVLPPTSSARQVGDELRSQFSVNSLTQVTVVLPDTGNITPDQLGAYAAALSMVPDVSAVSSPAGTFYHGVWVGEPAAPNGWTNRSAFLTVSSTAPLYSAESEAQLNRLHAVATPSGVQVAMTGLAQINHDSARAISSRLPVVLATMGAITLVLLFLLTGSVVLPLKALLLNMLSLTAAFGALAWIFQDGHLGGLGTTTTGTLAASVPVLLFCVAFGLSMDYEVFLISRIREHWLASAKTSDDNVESVALGLARTGQVVTAAALLMAVTFASFIAGSVSVMCMIGLGVTLAVLMDATLVRVLLVPAFMRLLGRTNWWAPQPLIRLHRLIGISEARRRSRPRTVVPQPVPAFSQAV